MYRNTISVSELPLQSPYIEQIYETYSTKTHNGKREEDTYRVVNLNGKISKNHSHKVIPLNKTRKKVRFMLLSPEGSSSTDITTAPNPHYVPMPVPEINDNYIFPKSDISDRMPTLFYDVVNLTNTDKKHKKPKRLVKRFTNRKKGSKKEK
jgi:hypothetical protein